MFRYAFKAVIDWLVRPRPVGQTMFRIGFALIAISFAAGWLLTFQIPNLFALTIDTTTGFPSLILQLVVYLGVALTFWGAVFSAFAYVIELQHQRRKRVFVVEQRGLHNGPNTRVSSGIPSRIKGRRVEVLMDIRQNVKPGIVISPEAALQEIDRMMASLRMQTASLDVSDVEVVYGGLVPVPFAFLTGMLFDDEGQVTVLDWDRVDKKWRMLDGDDDNDSFDISDMSIVPEGASEIVLGVSISYPLDMEGVRETFGTVPFLGMSLRHGSPNCHWSESKQNRLARQFLDVLIGLKGRRVQQVHLILAAQNSVSFRLGTAFDRRTLPPTIIYQYESSHQPRFAWGVQLPTHGHDTPSIVRKS